MENKQCLFRISLFDLVAMGYGAIQLFFVGILVISSYIGGDLHEDFSFTRGDYHAEISFILHTSTSLLILFFPLQRKIFGILSISLTIITLLFMTYFNRDTVGGVLFVLFFDSLFLLLPSLYILHSAFGRKV